jgi:hypothetical protein
MPIVTISIALRAKSPAKQGSRQKTLTEDVILESVRRIQLEWQGNVPADVELREAALLALSR